MSHARNIWLCGYEFKPGAFKFAHFYLHLNVREFTSDKDRATYQMQWKDGILWNKRIHEGDECTVLYDIPHGHHVVTISTSDGTGRNGNGEGKLHPSSITHLVTF